MSEKRPGVVIAHLLIRSYQLTLSAFVGRTCRHLPTCSSYMDEAIARHGLWAGTWMGLARFCRCHPFGTSGLDLVPERLPEESAWYKPWTFGRWRGVYALAAEPARNLEEPGFRCEAVEKDDAGASPPS